MIDELLQMYETYGKGEIADIGFDKQMHYFRTGSRMEFENAYFYRRHRLNACALLSLVYPEKNEYFDNLMNTVWAILNEYCWSLPNHNAEGETGYNNSFIDLFAAETGFALSEIRLLLEDRLEPLMNERIRVEIDRRIIRSFLENTCSWETYASNWAAVCAGSVACTFMHERPDLYETIRPRIDSAMAYFLSSYKEDGVCTEGLSYWQYGFGFFVSYAQRLLDFTNGERNLFEDEHVKTIARFPAAAFLDDEVTVSFADGPRSGKVGLGTMAMLTQHYKDAIPVFPKKCYTTHDNCARWCLHLDSFVCFDPQMQFGQLQAAFECFMKESQWFVKKCAGYGFAAKGGNNNEPHNHNDLGHFILCRGGRQILTDLGAGAYTRDYFSEKRYEIFCTRSKGHSVPIPDGCEQSAGEQYRACTTYENGKLSMDLTAGYPENRVGQLIREFTFGENRVMLEDRFAYREALDSCPVTERFVTTVCPRMEEGCVVLDEVKICPESGWEVNVSAADHNKHTNRPEIVYVIDFTSKEPKEQFRAVFEVNSDVTQRY